MFTGAWETGDDALFFGNTARSTVLVWCLQINRSVYRIPNDCTRVLGVLVWRNEAARVITMTNRLELVLGWLYRDIYLRGSSGDAGGAHKKR